MLQPKVCLEQGLGKVSELSSPAAVLLKTGSVAEARVPARVVARGCHSAVPATIDSQEKGEWRGRDRGRLSHEQD